MICNNPKCKNRNQNNFKELFRSNTDRIDGLDHSHMKCNICKCEFNHWHESEEKLKTVFGSSYNLYK